MKTSPLPLKRLLAEGVVIVAGVLLALAADGWMEEREERRLEDVYWTELRADLVQGDSILEAASAMAARRLAGANLVLDATRGRLSDTVSAEALVYGMSMANGLYSPPVPRDTWDEIVSEGRLSLLQDPSLRRDIAALYRSVDLLREFHQEWVEYVLPYRRAMARLLPPDVYAASVQSSLYSAEGVDTSHWPSLAELEATLLNEPLVAETLGDVLNVNLAAQRETDVRRDLIRELIARIDRVVGPG